MNKVMLDNKQTSFIEYIFNNSISEKQGIENYNYILENRIIWPQYDFERIELKLKKDRIAYVLNKSDQNIANQIRYYLVEKMNVMGWKNKSVSDITRLVQGNISNEYSFMKIDIEDYFNSIDHSTLLNMVESLNEPILYSYIENYLFKYYNQIGNNDVGLPIGVNLTQILSELYFFEFDKVVKDKCRSLQAKYFRYCDDILILLKDEHIESIYKFIEKKLSGLKLKININKYVTGKVKDRNLEYLGYNHKYRSLRMADETLNSFKYSIISIIKRIKSRKIHHNSINGVIIGFNNKWGNRFHKWEKSNPFHTPYGLAPFLSLCDDHKQIDEIEKWIGKTAKHYYYDVDKIEPLKKWVYRYKKDFVSTAILARAYRTDGKVYNKAKKVKFLSPNDLHVLLQDKKNTFYKNITDYLFVDLGEQKIYDLNKPYNPSLRTLRKLYNKDNTERLFYTCQIENFEKRTRRDYTFGLNLIFDYGYKEDCYNLEGESIPQYSSGAFS